MESELVSGFMTEHSSVIFVFFFLAEYASILFMCILISILFIGGYLYSIDYLLPRFKEISAIITYFDGSTAHNDYIAAIFSFLSDAIYYIENGYHITYTVDKALYLDSITGHLGFDTLSLGIKACIFVFVFIWVRAAFPRIRYDQLMSYCWLILLPIVVAFVLYTPSLILFFDMIPVSVAFLGFIPIKSKFT